MLETATPIYAIAWSSLLPSTSWIVLICGAFVLSITLLVLMLSRLGEAKPVMKCVILSVWAHVLLIGFAYTTKMLPERKPPGDEDGVRVQLISENELSDETNVEQWDQARSDFLPELFDEPIERVETVLTTPERLVDEQITREQPQLFDEPTFADADDDGLPVEVPNQVASDFEPETVPIEVADMETVFPNSVLESEQFPLQEGEALPRPETPEVAKVEPQLAEPSETLADNFDHELAQLIDEANSIDEAESIASDRDVNHREDARLPKIPVHQPRTQVQLVTSSVRELPARFQTRNEDRLSRAEQFGGSVDTEAAVEAALAWLASVQNSDGRWDASTFGAGSGIDPNRSRNVTGGRADTAITGLALLTFLGTGQHHFHGEYKQNIQQGLEFLLRSQSRNSGQLSGDAEPMAAMYCHGIATLALGEAYVLSKDERIRPFLERAINYTLAAQHPITGGWRYRPGDTGDTSQFGWQLMALTAAKSGGISVPDSSINGMHRWLERVSAGQHGGLARYKPGERATSTMTAEALACRLFLGGVRNAEPIEEAANHIARQGIKNDERLNLYYCYYGTIGMFQIHDHRWVVWNQQMTSRLVPLQRKQGALAGSWDPETVWGRNGGRVYSTALATLCLEIYYRYSLLENDSPNRTAARYPTLTR